MPVRPPKATPAPKLAPLSDVRRVRALLITTAKGGRALTYTQALERLGHAFTRPKMRALCKTMDAVDRVFEEDGAPALAVLVVRQSDGLPGQGWWIGKPERTGYDGPWTGPRADAFVKERQDKAFKYWRKR